MQITSIVKFLILYHRKKLCIFDDITPNPPIFHHPYVALIALVTVSSVTWWKLVMQRSLVVYIQINALSE